MFGFFASQEKKMRENAANWLELADKIWHFRRDVLPSKQVDELRARTDELRHAYKAKADAAKLKLSIEALEPVLRQTGGAMYPRSSLAENIEFFLVAAIVILGIRTFFVQPFKIPTNSMWPTYNGMTSEVYHDAKDEPGLVAKAGRLVAFGAWPHRLDAPEDGEILIPIGGAQSRGFVHSRLAKGRSWLVLPATVREYTLLVGNSPVSVKLPLDFDFDWTIYEAFFGARGAYSQQRFSAAIREALEKNQFVTVNLGGERVRCIRTGRVVKKGERVLAFDELTGDQLFVDRMSYHFVRPKVGSGFVFRTGEIPDLAVQEGDQYYIKRLVGVPGDTLRVDRGYLFRNGQPIEGSAAFEANGRKLGRYTGYEPIGLLSPGNEYKVGEGAYFAMGDNSSNSKDSRYWGSVPDRSVVGRPIFVYYPFTKHWGPAK